MINYLSILQIREDLETVSHYIPFYRSKSIQELLERVIYLLYQECMMDYYTFGMAQLVLVPLYVLIMEYQDNVYSFDINQFDEVSLAHLEQELYWISYSYFSKTDKEMFVDPEKFADSVEMTLKSYDEQLHKHLTSKNIQFLTITDGWLAKMLFPIFRKLPLMSILWDKYLASGDQFWTFHACVCTAILLLHKQDLLSLQTSHMIYEFNSKLTLNWGYDDMKNFLDLISAITEKCNLWNKISAYWIKTMRIKKTESTPEHQEIQSPTQLPTPTEI